MLLYVLCCFTLDDVAVICCSFAIICDCVHYFLVSIDVGICLLSCMCFLSCNNPWKARKITQREALIFLLFFFTLTLIPPDIKKNFANDFPQRRWCHPRFPNLKYKIKSTKNKLLSFSYLIPKTISPPEKFL